jgi:hypothetical protein
MVNGRARSIRQQAASRVVHDHRQLLDSCSRNSWIGQLLKRKETTMSNQPKNPRPLYRVTFARITGQDEHGQDVLGRPKEIGAVWPRKHGKSGAILSLDLIPIELTQRQGVIFLVPAERQGGAQ